jgi:hypothetical protein
MQFKVVTEDGSQEYDKFCRAFSRWLGLALDSEEVHLHILDGEDHFVALSTSGVTGSSIWDFEVWERGDDIAEITGYLDHAIRLFTDLVDQEKPCDLRVVSPAYNSMILAQYPS